MQKWLNKTKRDWNPTAHIIWNNRARKLIKFSCEHLGSTLNSVVFSKLKMLRWWNSFTLCWCNYRLTNSYVLNLAAFWKIEIFSCMVKIVGISVFIDMLKIFPFTLIAWNSKFEPNIFHCQAFDVCMCVCVGGGEGWFSPVKCEIANQEFNGFWPSFWNACKSNVFFGIQI